MANKILIAMCGLPRSGKSTIVERISKQHSAPIVRRDAIRLAVHGQRYEPTAEPLIKVLDLYMVRSLFLAGHETVICDETNYSRAARNHMLDPQWKTVFYWVPTDKVTCIKRAYATDQPDLHPIIEEMASRWEPFDISETVVSDEIGLSDYLENFRS